jgi:tetratricopeptide (TPR) repeat protein
MHSLNHWSAAGCRAHEVAWIYHQRSATGKAWLWANRCSEAWQRGGNRIEQAAGMRLRGLISRERHDYDTAERLYQEALTIYRGHSEQEVVVILSDLGSLELARRRYDVAEQYLREALAEKRDSSEGQAAVSGQLGHLALCRECAEDARKWFQKQLHLAESLGRPSLVASAKWGLALSHKADGRPDLAGPVAEEALAIYQRLGVMNFASRREWVRQLHESLAAMKAR